mgnify:CR=1 FL=1
MGNERFSKILNCFEGRKSNEREREREKVGGGKTLIDFQWVVIDSTLENTRGVRNIFFFVTNNK